jgi:glutamate synthase domain-containing protein 2
MRALLLPFAPRLLPYTVSVLATVVLIALAWREPSLFPYLAFFIVVFGGLAVLGTVDLLQTRHAILRNYPIMSHLRILLEEIRPEMRQYFFEDEKYGLPFGRDKRAIVYQRAKRILDKRPFGTQYDVHAEGSNAILALNGGARKNGFAHDTGEGGISRYHRERGGDLIWEIGSGYFGCCQSDGGFCADRFVETAALDQVKMIEVKLSQGAKPGHGGVLPAAKVTAEISAARGVPMARATDFRPLAA